MAGVPRKILPYGDQLVIIMSDGSKLTAYPTGGTMWVLKTTNPGPGPGEDRRFIWPFHNLDLSLDEGTITDEFGWVPDGLGGTRFHRGMDFGNPPASEGAEIKAVGSGTVLWVGVGDASGGNWVRVHHGNVDGNELYTEYLHMLDVPLVDIGDDIPQSTVLGYVGSTGDSSGPHLHLTTYENGSYINPRDWFAAYENY